MSTSGVGSAESFLWRRLYDAALRELDPQVLTQRIEAAKKAIHSQIAVLRNTDEASNLWELMDALRILDDLLRMNKIPTHDFL
jgi:hypothetical protein